MTLLENFSEFFSKLPSLQFEVADFLDICLVAFIIYQGIKIIRETRAMQLVKGLIFVAIIYLLIYQFRMQASSYIFRLVFQNIFIVLIILFQKEIRQVIERVGKSKFSSIGAIIKGGHTATDETVSDAILEIAKAIQRMSEKKVGSLIVMEKEMLLGDVIKTGTPVDAKITHELIGNVFFPNSPLHDGAAIVRSGRLHSAGCVLPLTQNNNISSDLGTRHRAAIGMSEQSDAMVIVTSEETGTISIALKGKLVRDLNEAELREKLLNYLLDDNSDRHSADYTTLKKIFKGWKKNDE